MKHDICSKRSTVLNITFLFSLRIRNALLKRWWNFNGRILCYLHGVTCSEARFHGMPIISRHDNSDIVIGKRVVLCSDSRFTALGVSRPIILRTLQPNAKIIIDDDTGLSGVVICAASSVKIGKNCLIGSDVKIFDTDFHKISSNNRRYDNSFDKIKSAPINIEDNVFIGAGSIIMKGVTIGENSVIGAGSVVTKDVPRNSIAVGLPAKPSNSVKITAD